MAPTTKSSKLEDQAATAALYATRGKGEKSDKSANYPLDADGKLSSASAATSLKHAQAQDLPAFPVVGVENSEASAGTAATLANKNQKTFEYWKPGEIPAASKAALLAKDYKMEPLWQPHLSAAGSKAALLAAKDGGNVDIWLPEDTDAGHSAAEQAMRKKGLAPKLDDGHTEDGTKRAMQAATGAMSESRKRSGSTPIAPRSYPDAANSAANALKAATSAGRAGRGQTTQTTVAGPSFNAGKLHNQAITNMSRDMYTSHPPVAPEVEEQKRQAGLRAAAVSMAKQMYEVQQKQSQTAAGQQRPQSIASTTETSVPQYANLQEAARKLAAERLAKLHDEHAAYRNYYGTEKTPHKRLSMRGRRHASSEGQDEDSDEDRSKQIRSQMSIFNDSVAQVDMQKRQKDRESLMAAAQRNVRNSMNAQDQRVFNETGKVSPAMMAEWESKANAKAEADSQVRMANHGMVNIGGGKFLNQSEVNAIAAAKVQPTLDEITAIAERHRARDEMLRQQQLERERVAAEKAADDKERAGLAKEEWKRFREEEKREERTRKEEAKAHKLQEKRQRDEEKQRSKDLKVAAAVPVPADSKEPIEVTSSEPKSVEVKPVETATIASGTTAEEIARRVFAAPVEGESTPSHTIAAKDISESEPQELADSTSNTKDAPVRGSEGITAKSTSAKADATDNSPSLTSNDQAPKIVEGTPKFDPHVTAVSSKPDAPVAARIVPTAVPESTIETTVSGPETPKTAKDKDGGKVSSWLKTKFRRSSKAGENPASVSTISDPKDPKYIVDNETLATSDNKPVFNSEAGNSSLRDVAMATTGSEHSDAPVVLPASAQPLAGHGELRRKESSSGSVSSLSSDEDTRGRSAIRMADTMSGNQMQLPSFGGAASHSESTAKQTGEATVEGSSRGSKVKRMDSSLGGYDEFEEARDEFDSEKLAPPEKGLIAQESRKSDSPARDSKFVEAI